MIRERLIDAGAIGGAAALVVTASWVAGVVSERDQLRAQAARPRPATTVTARPAPTASTPTASTTAPAPSSSSAGPPAAGVPITVAGHSTPRRPAGSGGTSSGGSSGSGGSTTRPTSPARPSSPAQPAACDAGGRLVAVRIELGVRPCVGLNLSG